MDTRKQINGFIAFLEVDLQKSNLVIRHVAEWLLGAHNHFDFRLTVDSRSKADCRVDYFSKDPSGDSIVKCKYQYLKLLNFVSKKVFDFRRLAALGGGTKSRYQEVGSSG